MHLFYESSKQIIKEWDKKFTNFENQEFKHFGQV